MKAMNTSAWEARKANADEHTRAVLDFAESFAEVLRGNDYEAAYIEAGNRVPISGSMVRGAIAMIYYFFQGGEEVMAWWNATRQSRFIQVDPDKRVLA